MTDHGGCVAPVPQYISPVALVSIIIPAFNEEKLLPATLRAIAASRAPLQNGGHDVEVIVCDNNSTDCTAEIARDAGASVVFEPLNQIARARNAGAAAASGDWLVFVDADSRVSPELLAALAGAIGTPRVIAGGTTVRMENAGVVARTIASGWNLVSRVMRWAAGSFIFCRADAFRAVGGFNEALYASEEIELFNKLKRHARGQKGLIRILTTPLVTSDRKMTLYTGGEKLRFFFRALFRYRTTVTSRDACAIWYDGRR
jgi:glycosyltransferase involved in cell wall biosynthesis